MLIGIKCFHDFLPLFTEVCLQLTQITTGNNELLILLTSISINAFESFLDSFSFPAFFYLTTVFTNLWPDYNETFRNSAA